ncbi:flagellin, partial [uncultured Clostridium sp.]|uniref:flagellin n=1 Tax=uncultured Clostridium sp. TaxID=59620 RepID=UPI002620ABD9
MRLHHNMMSLNVFKNYQNNMAENSAALKRISSGSKVMSAKDSPSKLAQSEHFKLQIRGLAAANKNVQDGVSMMQTADGGAAGISENLIRMRELVVKAGNQTTNEADREILQIEIDSIKEGIDDLANNTEFNGVKLIGNDNTDNSYSMAAGINSDENILIPNYDLSAGMIGDGKNNVTDIDIKDGDIDDDLAIIDGAMKQVTSARNKYGALANRFESLSNNQDSNSVMLEGANANITGADVAKEMMEFARTNILIESSNYMMAQTNELPNEAL